MPWADAQSMFFRIGLFASALLAAVVAIATYKVEARPEPGYGTGRGRPRPARMAKAIAIGLGVALLLGLLVQLGDELVNAPGLESNASSTTGRPVADGEQQDATSCMQQNGSDVAARAQCELDHPATLPSLPPGAK